MSEVKRLVFIPNKGHDFAAAEKYGKLVFLTEGHVSRLNTSQLYRQIADGMQDARADDLLLLTGMNVLNCIAAAIMAKRFGCLNLLLYKLNEEKPAEYVMRSIFLD